MVICAVATPLFFILIRFVADGSGRRVVMVADGLLAVAVFWMVRREARRAMACQGSAAAVEVLGSVWH